VSDPDLRSRRAGWAVLALIVGLLAVNGTSVGRGCNSLRPLRAGELAPDFEVRSVDAEGRLGGKFSLSSMHGKVIIVDFWATWCGPCRASMPVLDEVARTYKGQDLVVLSLNTEGPRMARAAREMANELAPSTILASDHGPVSALYKVTTIPHMLVIDREGRVRWVHRGFTSPARLRSDLHNAIRPLL
jgi:thiol-disulfide isomerase/thioredoxin